MTSNGSDSAPENAIAPRITCVTLGPYQTNCYIVEPQAPDGRCWIIDASFGAQVLVDRVRSAGLSPRAFILTHAHIDHIAGAMTVLTAFPGLPLMIHEAESAWLTDPVANMSALMGVPVTVRQPDVLLRDGMTLRIADDLPESDSWEVRHTPGHSPGGISLCHQSSATAITGDVLFAGSVGRTDFPGCSLAELMHSIRTRLYTLDDSTVIYPGHGPSTTIGREKRSNPFVRA